MFKGDYITRTCFHDGCLTFEGQTLFEHVFIDTKTLIIKVEQGGSFSKRFYCYADFILHHIECKGPEVIRKNLHAQLS